jgi:uncharacterized protein (TIGR02246 family)
MAARILIHLERTMSHSIRPAAYVILLFSFGLSACLGQDAASNSLGNKGTADLAAIRAESQAFVDAFNKGDAKAIAELWTEEGEYIDDSGHTFAGRDAIETGYARFFTENPHVQIRIVIDSLRLLGDSAAIEDGRAMVDPPPGGAPGIGKYTAVHVKVDGKWRMATVRDTRVETPSAYSHVADLEWLIGTWTAEEHGAKTESVCRWVANKSFVERSYNVTHADGTTISGVQLIGWNPQGGHVQSWNFSSDGGHAIGVWTPREQGWSAEVRGVTGDGTPTAAVNLLTRLDDNAYVWQSVQRTVGGAPLPDTDEVVLKRHSASQ